MQKIAVMRVKNTVYMFRLFLSGILIGIANLIPGISGGTVAVVTGIYDSLVNAISTFSSNSRKNTAIIVPVTAGTLSGIFLFSGIISFMLENYPDQSGFMFTGLIAGSFPFVIRKSGIKHFSVIPVILFTAAFIFIVVLSRVPLSPSEKSEILFSSSSAFKIFLSGIIAASAMIVPGISGSFILLLLGTYGTVLESINQFNIPFILVFFAGIAAGLALTSKAVNYLLTEYHTSTYFTVAGLIAGSVTAVFPGFSVSIGGASCIVCGISGFLISYFSGYFSRR